jgi:hypothetical protein
MIDQPNPIVRPLEGFLEGIHAQPHRPQADRREVRHVLFDRKPREKIFSTCAAARNPTPCAKATAKPISLGP